MKLFRKILLIVIVLSANVKLIAQQIEGTVSSGGNTTLQKTLNVKSGDDYATFSGDLNLDLPLFTVPGRNGLNFDVRLAYNSAIRNTQPETWVGLGFNLTVGSVSRSIVGSADDQSSNYFNTSGVNLASDYPTSPANVVGTADVNSVEEKNGILKGGTVSDKESWDIFMANFSDGSYRMAPLGSDPIFKLMSWKPWKIKFNVNSDGSGGDDISQLNNFIQNFWITKEDGTRYVFNKVSYMHIEGNQNSQNVKADLPISWELTAILSSDYRDVNGNGPDNADEGSWIKINYATTQQIQEYDNVTIGRVTYNALTCSVKYDYNYVSSIETPTHIAYINLMDKSNDGTIPHKLISSIDLKDKATNTIQKTYLFSYANGGNNTDGVWQETESLKDNRYALTKVESQYNAPTFGTPQKETLYKFAYSSNPGYDSQTSNRLGFVYYANHVSPWSLTKLVYGEGGYEEFEYERDAYNWYFWEISTPFILQYNSTVNTNYGSSRIRYRKIYDGYISTPKIFEYTYGQGIRLEPSTTYALFNYNEYARFTGTIGYRWVETKLPDSQGSIKKYFVSGVSPDNSYCNYSGAQSEPVDSTKESLYSYYRYTPGVGYDKYLDRSGAHGIVWKIEKKDANTTPNIIESTIYNHSFTTSSQAPNWDFARIINYSVWANNTSTVITRDGVSRTINYTRNNTNGLETLVSETNSNGVTKNQEIRYAFQDNADMQNANMLIQKGVQAVYQSPSSYRAAEKTTWKNLSTTTGIYRFVPDKYYQWNEDGASPSYSGSADESYEQKKEFVDYDSFGNLLLEKDANNNYTKYVYGHKGSKTIAVMKNLTSSTYTGPFYIESFDNNNISDGDPLTWSSSGFTARDSILKSTGTGYAGVQSYTPTSFTIETVLKIVNDYGNSANWAALHFGTTSISDYTAGYTVRYKNNGDVQLYSGTTLLNTAVTGSIPNVWRRLSVQVANSKIQVNLDGKTVIDYSATVASGYFSINTYSTVTHFDNIRCYPAQALVTSYAYHPKTLDLVEVVDHNLNSSIFHYDKLGRVTKKLSRINGRDVLQEESRYAKSMSLTASSTPAFDTNLPNTTEKIQYQEVSGYSDFSDASGWTLVGSGNMTFNYSINDERTVKMSPSGSTVSISKNAGTGHKIARIDFYTPNYYSSGSSQLLAFESTGYKFAVVGNFATNRFEIQMTKNGSTSSYIFPSTFLNGETWYTIEIEKNESGEAYAFISRKGMARIYEASSSPSSPRYMYYTTGYPSSWDANVSISTINNEIYSANFYAGLPQRAMYFQDGLGRPIQQVSQSKSESLISATSYSLLGYVGKTYKQYSTDLTGYRRHTYDPNYQNNADSYYNNITPTESKAATNGYPYSEYQYKLDALSRLEKQSNPGYAWRMGGSKEIEISYSGNSGTELRDSYSANQLFKTVTTDEQELVTQKLFDKFGNMIAEVRNPGASKLETDFYYDVIGNLTKVKDPKNYEVNNAYNTLQQHTQKTSVDAGTSKYLYDAVGNLRFIKDANHDGSINSISITNYSGGQVTSTSSNFTMNVPGVITIQLNYLSGSQQLTAKVKAINSNTELLSFVCNSYYTSASRTLYLPKGQYVFELSTTGTPNSFRYTLTCSDGFEHVYNKYDVLNRIIETGECPWPTGASSRFTKTNSYDVNFPSSGTGRLYRSYVYDIPSTDIVAAGQRNIKGKLSYSNVYHLGTLVSTTFYSYDDLGNLEWKVDKWTGTSYSTKMKYTYDALGNLLGKDFLETSSRNLYYTYDYDQLNRLNKVYTNISGGGAVQEGYYQYFANNKVKRLQLGNAQGLDYRYNCRDWLTMINHQNLSSAQDPGGDGANGIPVDKFGMQIGYNNNTENIGSAQATTAQYGGNISWIIWNSSGASLGGYPLLGATYSYDNFNRLTASNFGYWTTQWTANNAFDAAYTYDANGNFNGVTRNFSNGSQMDNLTYNYTTGTNRLQYITDTQSGSISTMDIDNQSSNNYLYDGNGNIIEDIANSVGFVLYDIFNLPSQVFKTTGTKVEYYYDINGNRIYSSGSDKYYVNSVNGLNEAVVSKTDNSLIIHNIYGNDLIGQVNRVGTTLTRYYYLKDHLGSIRERVDASGTVNGYDSYYPFGMQMDGLCSSTGVDVRYKFTGKERDLETFYDYFGARYYDSRIGRWLQVDPLASKYPGWSPYNYVMGNPLKMIDPNGKEIYNKLSGKELVRWNLTHNYFYEHSSIYKWMYDELKKSNRNYYILKRNYTIPGEKGKFEGIDYLGNPNGVTNKNYAGGNIILYNGFQNSTIIEEMAHAYLWETETEKWFNIENDYSNSKAYEEYSDEQKYVNDPNEKEAKRIKKATISEAEESLKKQHSADWQKRWEDYWAPWN